ncbi:S8/S53 family peptidase [bacterium]|nr:S8/S53 family peptidase [bacterium]
MSLKIQTKPKPKNQNKRHYSGWVMAFLVGFILALFFLGGCSQPASNESSEQTSTRYIDQAQIGAAAPFSMFNFNTKQSHPTANLEGVWNKDVGLDDTTTYTVSFLASAIGLTGEPITLKARVVNEKPAINVSHPTKGIERQVIFEDATYVFVNDHELGYMRYVPEKHEVVVGVIDSGIDATHPAFEGLVDSRSINVNDVLHNGDLVNSDDISDVDYEGDSHGTHVVSLVASKKQVGININGINDGGKVKLLVIKKGKGLSYYTHLAALKEVVRLQPDMINCSFGTNSIEDDIKAEYEKIRDAGILLVTSAGNDREFRVKYPSVLVNEGHENIITVGGLDWDGEIWSGSTWGFNDFMAPANGVLGAIDQRSQQENTLLLRLHTDYTVSSGTSFASPIITGVLAKMKSYDNTKSNAELKALLVKHAIDMPGDKDGYGRINYKGLAEEFVSFSEYNVINEDGIQFNLLVAKDKATGQVARAVLRYIYVDGAKFSIHQDIN